MVNRGNWNPANLKPSDVTPLPVAQNITGNGKGGFIPAPTNIVGGGGSFGGGGASATWTANTPVLQQSPTSNNASQLGGRDNANKSNGITNAKVLNPASASTSAVVQEITNEQLAQLIENESNYFPNSLSSLYNYAYHFKFYLTSEEDLVVSAGKQPDLNNLHKILDSLPKVIIAESGVTTGFNIKEVEIENILGPNYDNRGAGEIKNMRMTIVEPLGTSLMESILSAAISLDVQNFLKMWYFIELTFTGYDEHGNVIPNAVAESMRLQNGGRWVYRVKITNMEMHMDEGGATYNIDMIPQAMEGFDDGQCGCVPDTINVSGGTIKEFCDNLATNLTKAWSDRYAGELYKFNFQIHPIKDVNKDPNTFVIVPSEDDPMDGLSLKSQVTTTQNGRGGSGPTTGHSAGTIGKGVRIPDIIGYLYAHCDEAQKLILDVNQPGVLEDSKSETRDSTSATYNGKKYRIPIVPIVEPEVIITGYDEITGQYMKDITYHIYGYRNFTTNLTPEQDENHNADPKVSYDMVSDLLNRGFLKKKYEHRFTGLNTEVIRFDLDFNFAFNAILPKFTGWNADVRAYSTHASYNPNNNQNANSAIEAAYNELKSNPSKLTIKQKSKLLYAANQTLDTYTSIATAPSSDTSVTDKQRRDAQKQVSIAKDVVSRLEKPVKESRTASLAARKAQINQLHQRANLSIFAEDLMPGDNPFKITYVEQNNESVQASGTGFVGPWHKGASLVGALFNQLHQPLVQALTSVSLDIRGDPYWLGRSSLEKTAFHNGALIPSSKDLIADGTDGDCAMSLIFKFPYKIDPVSGVPLIRRDDVFTGIYRVINVKNSFIDGQFKQTLQGIKIDLARIAPKMKAGDNISADVTKVNQSDSTSHSNKK